MHWIAATIIAAFFQNLRSSLQKSLNDQMSLMASTYVRFVFALPFSALLFFGYFKDLNIPVFTGFPAGHNPDNRALIFGEEVELKVSDASLTLQMQ